MFLCMWSWTRFGGWVEAILTRIESQLLAIQAQQATTMRQLLSKQDQQTKIQNDLTNLISRSAKPRIGLDLKHAVVTSQPEPTQPGP